MRMLGKVDKPSCKNCCGDPTTKAKRRSKRRERQRWKIAVRSGRA